MVATLPVRIALFVFSITTVALMIAACAIPNWYTYGNSYDSFSSPTMIIGLWEKCSRYPSRSSIGSTSCDLYITDGVGATPGAIRSAQAFSLMAVSLAGISLILSAAVEYKDSPEAKLVRLPRVLSATAAASMACAAFSIVGFVYNDYPDKSGIRYNRGSTYGASFSMAWVSVFTSLASGILSFLRQRLMASASIPTM